MRNKSNILFLAVLMWLFFPCKGVSQIDCFKGAYLCFSIQKPIGMATIIIQKADLYKRVYILRSYNKCVSIRIRDIQSEKELHDYNLEKDTLSIPAYKCQNMYLFWTDKGMDEFINNYVDRIEILTDEGNVILADKESIKRFLRKDKKHVKHHRLKYKISRKNIRKWKNQ